MLLYEVSIDKNNNLNIIRFVASIMVIYAHAYALSMNEQDPLSKVTGGQISLGGVAVCIFFFFSGFLINKSVNKDIGARNFFLHRLLRIFPSLIVVVSFCTFILGGIATELGIQQYFTNSETYQYLLNAVLVLRHDLPGVFEHNIYGKVVNGALWTLPVELFCYIMCFFAYRMGILKEQRLKFTIPFFVVGYIIFDIVLYESGNSLLRSVMTPISMFYIGILYYTYRRYINIRLNKVLVCIAGLVFSILLSNLHYGILIFLPYILTYLAFGTKRKLCEFGRKREISYEIYLCAFPIQQTVIMLFGGSMNPVLNFLLSLPISLFCALLLNLLIKHKIKLR